MAPGGLVEMAYGNVMNVDGIGAINKIVAALGLPSIIWPSMQVDPHADVAGREYNWHQHARGLVWPRLTVPFALAALAYRPTVLLGIKLMQDRKKFDLRYPLFCWNMMLSLVSGVAAWIVLVDLVGELSRKDVVTTLCDHSIYTKWSAIAVAYFNATKIFEWGDTIFLIVRKRRVIFLHWFHHLLTMVYCWHASLFSYRADASGFFFAGMNLFVHAVMYLYFALAAIDIKLPYSVLITVLQTGQMVCGVILLALTPKCADSWRENWHGNCIAVFMYAVYLYLFAQVLFDKVKKRK